MMLNAQPYGEREHYADESDDDAPFVLTRNREARPHSPELA